MRWIFWSVCLSALAGAAAGSSACAAGAAAAPSARLRVITSCLPVYCFTQQIAGDGAAVDNLLPPGTEAHDFQLTRHQRGMLDEADLIVVNGLGMEPWLPALERSSPGRRVVEAAAGLGRLPDGRIDPHVWLDPLLACRMVTNILFGLQKADPARAGLYAGRASVLIARLESLDHELREGLRSCRGRGLVTQHNAFAHFARRYELPLVGVVEESPDIAPSPRHLSKLRQAILEHHVSVVFVEPRHSSKLTRQLARDLGLRIATLDPLESGDTEPGAYEEGMHRIMQVLQQNLK